jgi:dihydrofolate reductase
MQGLGGPDEDCSGGFERGGWAIPLIDAEAGDYLNQVYGAADAFLFGRRTYEIFAGYWGVLPNPETNPIAAALNSRPKYVVATSLSGALVRWLLANGLVDRLDLVTYPVVVGQGTRLFPDSGPDMALELVSSRTTSRGITIQTYRPLGRPEYAASAAGPEDVFS